MRGVRFGRAAALLLLALASGCDPTPLTQVSVLVEAEGAAATASTLEVNVYDQDLELVDAFRGPPEYPREFVAYQVEQDVFVIEILAIDAADNIIAAESATVTFEPERVALLHLTLTPQPAACPDCSVDERCPVDRCEPGLAINARDLPDRR